MDYDAYISEPLPFMAELSKYYKRNDKLTIFDIGCCEGEDSIRLKKQFPNSRIFSFEPLPSNVIKIKKNLKRYGLSQKNLYLIAFGDNDGKAVFYVSSGHPDHLPKLKDWDYGNKSSSLLPPKKHKEVLRWVKFKQKISVSTRRLDSFCQQHSIDKIDFIYLDVQGAELMVLRGAGNFIKRIGAIWLEVEAVELYANQPLKKEVESFMRKNGFVCVKDTVDEISGDQLYINKHLRELGILPRAWAGLSGPFFKLKHK